MAPTVIDKGPLNGCAQKFFFFSGKLNQTKKLENITIISVYICILANLVAIS
jgi:hypothetical protein